MALALGEAGARVALVSRDAEKLSEVAEAARGLGAEAAVFRADVGKEDSVFELERDVSAQLGPVDILVNNAGTVVRKDCVDFTLADWNLVLDTNLTSAFLMCRSFVPHMKGRGYGRVINITSIMSHISLPQRTAYSASKAGLLGFTRALALELAPDGITVVAISPGPFLTEMTAPLAADPAANAQFNSRVPRGDRQARLVSVLGGSVFHYRHGYFDRRRLVCAVDLQRSSPRWLYCARAITPDENE
jgi:NAD(P)-dependent dehydrogenase (short-subunit alcohol dehydrogenase family)